MFGLWKSRKVDVIEHWYALLPDFQSSTPEFYQSIEDELQNRQVPDLEISRIEFSEGGPLSPRRQYLRMRRERLIFDVCSASFGDSWFFSCRYAEIPFTLRIWEILVMLGVLLVVHGIYAAVFGMMWGSIVFAVTIIAVIFLLNSVLAMGLYSLDAKLLKIPVLGAFYEVFLRRNTYYREDSRLMYCDLVDGIVRGKIQEVADVGDVRKVEFKKNLRLERVGFFALLLESLRNTWRAMMNS
jgi:hypothetical protein